MATPNGQKPTRASGNGKSNGKPAATGGGLVPAVVLNRLLSAAQNGVPAWAIRLLRPRPPEVAVLFSRDRFTVVRVHGKKEKGRPALTHVISEELAEGTLIPNLTSPNILAPASVAGQLGKILDGLPLRKKMSRVSVVIPDCCARVNLLDLRELPRSATQAREMIEWQMRKRVPFRLEDARLSYQRFPLGDGSERILVTLALDAVLSQYENVLESLGLQPGLVDLSTFNLANLHAASVSSREAGDKDVVFVNATPERISLLVMRDEVPLFYRSKVLTEADENVTEKARREIQRELTASFTYYRDRLARPGSGISQAYLRASRMETLSLAGLVGEAVGMEPRQVALESVVEVESSVAVRPEILQQAAPAVGMVIARGVA